MLCITLIVFGTYNPNIWVLGPLAYRVSKNLRPRYAPPMPSEPAITVSVEGMKFQQLGLELGLGFRFRCLGFRYRGFAFRA